MKRLWSRLVGRRVLGGWRRSDAPLKLDRAQQALRESEARLKGIIASATDAIIAIDAAHKITIFNAGAEAIFGYSAEEMITQPLDRLIPERFRAAHQHHIQTFGATGVSMRQMGGERILTGRRRSGEEFPIEARISQSEVGGEKLYTVIIRDVTERKRAEEERGELLRVAEQARSDAEHALEVVARMHSITEAALADLPLDQLLQELTRRVREVLESDAAVILLEEGKEEVLHARAAAGLEEEVRAGVRVPVGNGFAGLVAKERRPIVVNDVSGEQFAHPYIRERGIRSLVGVPLLSGEGRVLGVLHVDSIQPQKFGAEEVRLLQLAAERVVLGIERAARIEAERRAREDAEAASRAKDEFLAMLSHELRNPLFAVRTAIKSAGLDDAQRDRSLEIARRGADQLGQLIEDLLDVARITRGRITLRTQRARFAGIVERAVETTRALVEERAHLLTVSLPDEDVKVEADPTRLEQIIVNLITNAAKYTQPSGRIEVMGEREGEDVVLHVRDNGIGIAPEMLPRIFDLFAQAERGLDRAQGGLGIGLTVARRLAALHGGEVEARSEGLGKGAEFIVRLPALPAAPEQATTSTPPAGDAYRGHARVLLVEDNPDTAESVKMLLELLGHRVRVVSDGMAALDAAGANVPDVMLVDIGLPGIDGYEVARRVRQDLNLRRVVLVAVTGYGREEDKQKAMTAGFDYHLTKPVDLDVLQGLVARLGRPEPAMPPTLH